MGKRTRMKLFDFIKKMKNHFKKSFEIHVVVGVRIANEFTGMELMPAIQ